MQHFLIFLSFIVALLPVTNANAQDKVLRIYLDADRSRHVASAKSIEMGIKAAFADVNDVIQGRKIEFIALDHRGNSTRSKLNMDKAFSDPQGLLVVAGMHSPPLIKHRRYINENKMLTLVPWAAGSSITRYPSSDNWVFRLSIDDSKAGYKIAEYALKTKGCSSPHLLLEQTPWGEANNKTMSKAIAAITGIKPPTTWFNWGLSEESARIKWRAIIESGAECALFVGNSNDGRVFTKAMISMDENKRLPIYSHWGITGGNFAQSVPAAERDKINLNFIQTCFSFVSSPKTPLSEKAFSNAQVINSNIKTPKDIEAPAGFIHAYDIGRLLIQALSQIELDDNMATNRANLKNAFENLQAPVQGLVKEYKKPFSIYSEDNKDAHEALGSDDFCMAHYGANDEIILLEQQ